MTSEFPTKMELRYDVSDIVGSVLSNTYKSL